VLDLDYPEDSQADVDMNLVMNDKQHFIEIQGTAESKPFDSPLLISMLDLGKKGIRTLQEKQRTVLGL
jgi:ribonuclease PH